MNPGSLACLGALLQNEFRMACCPCLLPLPVAPKWSPVYEFEYYLILDKFTGCSACMKHPRWVSMRCGLEDCGLGVLDV